ncbi:MAG TPA: hypothetical protein VF211_06765 [Burkholderiales bacterium]
MVRLLLCFVVAAALALPGAAARAERATERYAPAQIYVARHLLEHARAALAMQEYAAAASYAQQAQVDARIAWGMTDARALRAQAEAILAEAAALTTHSRAQAAASYPSTSARAPAAVPSPR